MSFNSTINLCGVELTEHRHVCGFFNSKDEEFEFLLPFVKDGVERGGKSYHIIDPKKREDYLGLLRKSGIEEEGLQLDQVEVATWPEVYLKPGRFDMLGMLETVHKLLGQWKEEGYSLGRIVAHMEWGLLDEEGVEDLVEYECRVNDVLSQYDYPAVCTYDVSKFSSEVILGVLRTHPLVILGGAVHYNPFYVRPEELLKEMQSRKALGANA